MSDSPDPRQQTAIAEAGTALAQARRDRDETARAGGARAVAEAAGHEGPDADRVAAHYAGLARRVAQGFPPELVTDPGALETAAAAYAAGRSSSDKDGTAA